jgi:hypothetical protein
MLSTIGLNLKFIIYYLIVCVNVLIDLVQPMISGFLATFDNSLNLVFKMFKIKIFEVNTFHKTYI